LLRALPYLEETYGDRDWLCLLMGRPHPAMDIQALAAELGIGTRVWFTGFLAQEDWVKYVSTADICVDPGSADPANNICTTNKMMDYMALGKPVVAFDLPERRGTSGETALYARVDNLPDLAFQIHRLIESPELRLRLGNAGLELVERRLAWQFQKQRLLELFSQLTHWQPQVDQQLLPGT
jgi:glycosyltransferase involved in cell wall biosynthesis